jgi:hypothetical protein
MRKDYFDWELDEEKEEGLSFLNSLPYISETNSEEDPQEEKK